MRTDRIFSRLEQEPHRPCGPAPRMSRTRLALFSTTVAFYLAIVVAVLGSTWLVQLDWQVMLFRPYKQWPEIHGFLDAFVVLGQRGPTAVLVAAWLGWRSWRQRTLRPLLALGFSLLLLNMTVGAVKIGLGRLGPHYATSIGSPELFAGGDIFPSGHTANGVVTWGILAYLATTPLARRWLSVVGAVFSLGVGATTVYLGTHWVSDVLLGWAAGLLILLGLPWCEPAIARAEALIFALRERFLTSGWPLAPKQTPVQPVRTRQALVTPRAVPAQETAAGARTTTVPRSAEEARSADAVGAGAGRGRGGSASSSGSSWASSRRY